MFPPVPLNLWRTAGGSFWRVRKIERERKEEKRERDEDREKEKGGDRELIVLVPFSEQGLKCPAEGSM